MTSVFIKNKILKELSKHGSKGLHSPDLAKALETEHFVIYSLCMEMELRTHVKNLQTSTVGDPFSCISSITPQGMYFINNGGYLWEWTKTFVVDFPKNFWWIIAIVSYLFGKHS